jgi:hypothetical protein
MKLLRQGDVLLKPISALPMGLKKKNNILAEGESTGHLHKIGKTAQVYIDSMGRQYVETEGTELTHEEHDLISVPNGIYEVIIQREFTPLQGIKAVMD